MSETKITCPDCKATMKLRKSSRGEFYGCSRFPVCRGTRSLNGAAGTSKPGKTYLPITKVNGTYEQEAIWSFFAKENANGVLNCGPGTGKTFTAIQWCLRAPKSQKIMIIAFNKHIAAEANGKLLASGLFNVKAKTLHGVGLTILTDNFASLQNVQPDEDKIRKILEALSPMPISDRAHWRRILNLTEKLVNFVRGYVLDYSSSSLRESLEALMEHHNVEASPIELNAALALLTPALEECKAKAATSIDFTDMIWLPIVLDLYPTSSTPDLVMIDEAQDLDESQHELIFRFAGLSGKWAGSRKSARIVIIGDRRQAIYEWRGAASDSIDKLAARLSGTKRGIKEFPLTITQRCSKLNVEMAKAIFPDIQALDNAPMGEVLEMNTDAATVEMKAGDMVICRVNKDLIPVAYSLIKRGIRPVVKGRDIGKGLITLIDHLKQAASECPGTEMEQIRIALNLYQSVHEQEFLAKGDKGKNALQALRDKCGCLSYFIAESKSILEMRTRITTLFSDDAVDNSVTLGTIHRTKGLEAERVFVLSPELLPHPMAKKPHEIAQENHLAWIAATRTKFNRETGAQGTTIFCGQVPAIYMRKAEAA